VKNCVLFGSYSFTCAFTLC